MNSVFCVSVCRLFETHPECKDVFFLFRDVEDLERLRSSRELRAHGLRSVNNPENVNIGGKLGTAASQAQGAWCIGEHADVLTLNPVLEGCNPTGFLTLLGRQLVHLGSDLPWKDRNPSALGSNTIPLEYLCANMKPLSSTSFNCCLFWEKFISTQNKSDHVYFNSKGFISIYLS